MIVHDKVAVIGGGLMGAGLARLFGAAGWSVAVSEPDAATRARLAAAMPEIVACQEIAEAVPAARLVIEAAPEIPALKQAIFAELAALTGAGTLLATNSSVIPVGVVGAQVPDRESHRVLGAHFWNPPDIVPLVEIIQAPRTSDDSIAAAMAIMRSVGKEPVHVRADVVPGNRMQMALWREAMALVGEGVCSAADLDLIVKRSFGLRLPALGPLENIDLIGLDLAQQIHQVVGPALSAVPGPVAALTDRVNSGQLGVKTGAGFYDGWTEEATQALRRRLADHLAWILAKPPD